MLIRGKSERQNFRKYVGKAESTNLNVGKYGTPNSNESVMSNAVSDGKSIGKAVQLPSMSGGTINSNYTKEGQSYFLGTAAVILE